jgi:hypothetical protein
MVTRASVTAALPGEAGQALPIVLGIITFVFLIGTAIATQASAALRVTAANRTEAMALAAADAAAELAIWWWMNGKTGAVPATTINGLTATGTIASVAVTGGGTVGTGDGSVFTDFCIFGAGDDANGNTTNVGGSAVVRGLVGGNRTVTMTASSNAEGILAGWEVIIGQNAGGPVTGYPNLGFKRNVVANGTASLVSGSRVTGNVDATATSSGVSISVGTNARIDGNATAVGTVNVGSGASVGGTISAPNGAPRTFTKLSLPTPSTYSANTDNRTVANGTTVTLAPGTYGTLTINSNGVLNLSSGRYVFAGITTSSGAVINFAISGADVEIYSTGNVALGTTNTWNVSGGTGKNIYLETAARFSTSASFSGQGTIYSTETGSGGAKSIAIGGSTASPSTFTGALYAREQVDTAGGAIITCETGNHFAPGGTYAITVTGSASDVTVTALYAAPYPYSSGSPVTVSSWTTTR